MESDVQALSPGLAVTPTVKLLRPLGQGGMGSVWVAEHLSLHTEVVVKFMSDSLVSNKEAGARFSREAAAAARVKSPHVVHMLDHGITEEGTPYIVMELLVGEELSKRLARLRRLPPAEVAAIVAQVSKALARAHAMGIFHRDIKPENIFLTEHEGGEIFVKLLDFGIAKAELKELSSATTTGQVIGTPAYMSPEQILGKEVDLRSDLWSLAVVAFEALTGEQPFKATTVGALALEIHNAPTPIPSLVNSELSPEIDAWFLQACRREPAERFQTAKDLSAALSGAVYGAPPPGTHTGNITGGFAAMDPMRPRAASITHEPTESLVVEGVKPVRPSALVLGIVATVCAVIGAALVTTFVARPKNVGPDTASSASLVNGAAGGAAAASSAPAVPPIPPADTSATSPSASTSPAEASSNAATAPSTTKPPHSPPTTTGTGTHAATSGTGRKSTKKDDFDIK